MRATHDVATEGQSWLRQRRPILVEAKKAYPVWGKEGAKRRKICSVIFDQALCQLFYLLICVLIVVLIGVLFLLLLYKPYMARVFGFLVFSSVPGRHFLPVCSSSTAECCDSDCRNNDSCVVDACYQLTCSSCTTRPTSVFCQERWESPHAAACWCWEGALDIRMLMHIFKPLERGTPN